MDSFKSNQMFPQENDPGDKIRQLLDNSDSSSSEMNKIDDGDAADLMSNLGNTSQISSIPHMRSHENTIIMKRVSNGDRRETTAYKVD